MRPTKKDDLTSRTNTETRQLLASVNNEIKLKTKLKQLLDERGMKQADLVKATGIGKNFISAFVNNREGVKIGYSHIYAIMIALRLTELSELLYIELPDDVREKFNVEAEEWKETKQPPTEIRTMIENSDRIQSSK